jgi:peptidoglycan hydrolase-like protein with peptidoglycan-binding domain
VAVFATCVLTFVAATAQAAPRSFGSRVLAQPMRGPDVKVLQQLLTDWGLPTAIDGEFGRHTKLRVRSWERNSGRRIDGRVSPADATALQESVERGETLADVEPEDPEFPTDPTDPTEPTYPTDPTVPAETATIVDGLAVAPASAPPEVQAIIEAGNAIATKPYKYGGGHGRWRDSGYDCSGSMSYVLHAAGLLDEALDSTGFMSFGDPGKGTWVTTYGHGSHSYMMVAGLRFDTSGMKQDGSRWHTSKRSARGYTVRHPPGL